MNESDLRVVRTRRLLREALIELVIAKGYESVTIRDITKRAQVGYKTFFRHYESKEALLNTISGEMLAEFQALLEPPSSPEEKTINAFHHTAQHPELARVLFASPAAGKLLQPLMAFMKAEGEHHFGGSDMPDELVAYHFASGMMGLMRWWLEHDMPYSPDQMAEYVNRLVIRPMSQL